jgi:general secretion pathway protein A
MTSKLRDLYGLKWNPFSQDVPIEALLATTRTSDFLWRIEHGLCVEGGFAMITGGPHCRRRETEPGGGIGRSHY